MHLLSWEPLCEPNICIFFSVFRVTSGPTVKLAGRKSTFTTLPVPGGLLYWPFLGGGPGVGLTLCYFVVYSTRRLVLSFALCYFV